MDTERQRKKFRLIEQRVMSYKNFSLRQLTVDGTTCRSTRAVHPTTPEPSMAPKPRQMPSSLSNVGAFRERFSWPWAWLHLATSERVPVKSHCHVATVSAVRSGKRSTGRCCSRSTKMVPSPRPFRKAKSSSPRTRGAGWAGARGLRILRRTVSYGAAGAGGWPSAHRLRRPPRPRGHGESPSSARYAARARGHAPAGVRQRSDVDTWGGQRKRRTCKRRRIGGSAMGRSRRRRV
jgi:hypothetical protein